MLHVMPSLLPYPRFSTSIILSVTNVSEIWPICTHLKLSQRHGVSVFVFVICQVRKGTYPTDVPIQQLQLARKTHTARRTRWELSLLLVRLKQAVTESSIYINLTCGALMQHGAKSSVDHLSCKYPNNRMTRHSENFKMCYIIRHLHTKKKLKLSGVLYTQKIKYFGWCVTINRTVGEFWLRLSLVFVPLEGAQFWFKIIQHPVNSILTWFYALFRPLLLLLLS